MSIQYILVGPADRVQTLGAYLQVHRTTLSTLILIGLVYKQKDNSLVNDERGDNQTIT